MEFGLNALWLERLGSPVVRALGSRLDAREFDSRLVIGWVTIFGQANHLSISPSHPGQLSILPSVGQEMNIPDKVW